MEDDFGVAVGAEDVALCLQLGPQVEEVVKLAVEDDAARVVLVPNRLLTAGEVDDAQPPHAEKDALPAPRSDFVGAAMEKSARRCFRGKDIDAEGA